MLRVLAVVLVLVSLSIALHYEALRFADRRLPFVSDRPRWVIVRGLVFALVAHVAEVWLFALGYFGLTGLDGVGRLEGRFDGSLLDCSYYSFVVYTSLGFGDITPEGPLRTLTGMEALTGLVLVAWTASFLFVRMQRLWTPDQDAAPR